MRDDDRAGQRPGRATYNSGYAPRPTPQESSLLRRPAIKVFLVSAALITLGFLISDLISTMPFFRD